MTDEEQKLIFKKNLRHYVELSGKQQIEIAKELDIPYQTFNGWCKGVSIPTMGKVQKLADYFGIGKTDLLDESQDISRESIERILRVFSKGFNTSKDAPTVDYVIQLLSDENLQLLIEAARKSRPDDVKMAAELLERLNKE